MNGSNFERKLEGHFMPILGVDKVATATTTTSINYNRPNA